MLAVSLEQCGDSLRMTALHGPLLRMQDSEEEDMELCRDRPHASMLNCQWQEGLPQETALKSA
jgi:hypothetical protein